MTSVPHYEDGPVTIWHGDCIEIMSGLPDSSVDAVVTDPPYGLEFMGKDWDAPWAVGTNVNADAGFSEVAMSDGAKRLPRPSYTGSTNPVCINCGGKQRGRKDETAIVRACSCPNPKFPNVRAIEMRAFQDWCLSWATEALRVLKPGGHLLAFGGTRTFHRLTAGIEDAGFEIRDSIAWLYGSGFPKSLDVSKAIDKAAGATREVVGSKTGRGSTPRNDMRGGRYGSAPLDLIDTSAITAPATPDAQKWAGWGTALKPSFEPIVVARKPLAGTVAANVLQHGTGALNIDATRIAGDVPSVPQPVFGVAQGVTDFGAGVGRNGTMSTAPGGRWPANVILDASQAATLDQQSGTSTSRASSGRQTAKAGTAAYGNFDGNVEQIAGHDDSGGASRFFYTAKAPGHERPEVDGTSHPTVKPLDLMQWLVKLVTPKGGTVLEPFAGSGTTVEACIREGFNCIAIEREVEYLPLILKRIRKDHAVGFDFGDWDGAA